MANIESRDEFFRSAGHWICGEYSAMIQYIAFKDRTGAQWLADARITVSPVPASSAFEFSLERESVQAGQIHLNNQTSDQILDLINLAKNGEIQIHAGMLSLGQISELDFHSEMTLDNRWFSDLHLEIIGPRSSMVRTINFSSLETQLRQSDPPFDGLQDLNRWLGTNVPRTTDFQPSIKVRIRPPVDIDIPRSTLADGTLTLVLHAHPKLDVESVRLAIRAVPSNALEGRLQAGTLIQWDSNTDAGYRRGIASVKLDEANNVLAMLMLADGTVRRQYFLDPAKAGNQRYTVIRHFDHDLSRLEKSIFDTTDSKDFEKGIAALAFLLGFAPAICAQHNAPDLVMTSPNGRLAIVECTLRIADFATKLGKLVDRSRSIKKAMLERNYHGEIFAILVCALPRDQIKHSPQDLIAHGITLITREDLEAAFEQLQGPIDADALIDRWTESPHRQTVKLVEQTDIKA